MAEEEIALNEGDVRAIVRLLGDVAVVEGGVTAKRQRLMNGLAELVDADGWLWTISRVDVERDTPMSVGLLHGGLTERQIAAWAESSQEQIAPLPEHKPLTELFVRGEHFTRTRGQIVPDSVWYAHPTVRAYRLDVGLDDFLYSIYPLEPGLVSAIGLYRHRGRPPFEPRLRRLTHIVTSEVKWLHWAGLPEDKGQSVPQLSPRLRAVLVLMLEGHPRKRVASLLGISLHTVSGYVKALYRHFDVSSQAELMRRFTVGDGRDQQGEGLRATGS